MAVDQGTAGAEPLAQRELWRQVFNLAQDLHCLAGPDGYFRQLNPAWEELLGYSRVELMSRPLLELVHPDDVRTTAAKAARLAEGEHSVLFENRYRRKDGSYIWLEWRGTPAGDGLIYAIARDISDRKRHEEALSQLSAAAVAMSGVSDLEALGRIVVSRATQLLLADTATASWLEPEDGTLVQLADSGDLGDLPARRPVSTGALGAAVRDGRPVLIADYPNWPEALPLNQERMPASVLAVPLRIGERVVGALAVASRLARRFDEEDVQLLSLLAAQAAPAFELARLVAELQEANLELRRASEVKSQFLANMSHELRTPLNAILGFSELLLDDMELEQETKRDYLQTVYGSGQHLLTLINDLLDLAKIEAGRVEVQPGNVALRPLVGEAISSLESLALAKRIKLQNLVGPRTRIWADSRHTWQILINLISNAIKFTPEGGRVTVSSTRHDETVEIAVSDTGIGIAPEDLAVIFDEFAQVESGLSRLQKGTGLGLALSRRLAALNGGRIDVASTLGHGSTFTVRLPAPQRKRPRMSAPRPDSLLDGAPFVLVVDDDPAAVQLLTHHLQRAGYGTQVAYNGDEALDLARTLHPIAITLDLLLPKLDGWEVLRALKADQQTRNIPVVVVSVVDDQRRARALGAVDFLVKPIDPHALVSRLRQLLDEKPWTDQTKVLVVDDDAHVLALLDKTLSQAGVRVITASGGAEGIARAEAQRPDAMILDLVMPDVDGFEVVGRLRSKKATRGIPILILTAKDLTMTDKARLNGRVAAVLQKADHATVDLVAWVKRLAAAQLADG